jgi:hypothetical protein
LRIRVVLLTAAAALVVIYLLRSMAAPEGGERAEQQARVPRTPRQPGEAAAAVPSSLRNVFEYSDVVRPVAPPASRPVAAATLPPLTMPSPSPSPAVRLVGLVHRAGRTRAALAVAGDTVVLGAGETAAGYTVVSIDEDEGVRVRTPDGTIIVLAATRDQ